MDRTWIFTWVWWHYLGLLANLIWRDSRLFLALVFLFHAPSLYLVHFIWFDPRLHTTAFAASYVGCGLAVLALWEGGKRFLAMTSPAATSKHEVQVRPRTGTAAAKRRSGKARAGR
jgi:hypothetical protein